MCYIPALSRYDMSCARENFPVVSGDGEVAMERQEGEKVMNLI
jgi:hypothetical protein